MCVVPRHAPGSEQVIRVLYPAMHQARNKFLAGAASPYVNKKRDSLLNASIQKLPLLLFTHGSLVAKFLCPVPASIA